MAESTDNPKPQADDSNEESGDDQTQAFHTLDSSETFGLDSFAPLQSNPGASVGKEGTGRSTSPPEDEPQQTLKELPDASPDVGPETAPETGLETLSDDGASSRDGEQAGDALDTLGADGDADAPTLPADDLGDLPTIIDTKSTEDEPVSALDDLLAIGMLDPPDAEQTKQGIRAVLAGRYAITKKLGEGGMGVVFLAHDKQAANQASADVAIKMIRPRFLNEADARQRFVDEATQMSKLPASACVLGVRAIGSQTQPYYVMEYMPGGSLGQLLRKETSLKRDRVIELAINIATAINQVHVKTGRIHRDIKPENILLASDGSARLCDFGLIFAVGEGESGLRAGTLAYMPPEVVTKDNKNIGFEWDIYSFGALLYEMLSGTRPYNDIISAKTDVVTRMRTLRQAMVKRPPDGIRKLNRKADTDLVMIAEGAMAREVRDRYVSMADVLSDLQRIKRGKQPLGPRQRRGVGLAITLVALLALFVSGALVWPKLFPADPIEVDRIVGKPGVKIDPPLGLVTTEAGGEASFAVVLDSKPRANVVFKVESSNPDEGTPNVTELTFTPENWKKPQAVNVIGKQDRIADGAVSYAILLHAQSEDEKYHGFAIDPVGVTNQDDDVAGIDLASTPGQATSEKGTKVRFEVALRSQPTAAVTLPLRVSDKTEAMVEPASLTFTPEDWSEAKTVTVIGKADKAQDGSVRYAVDVGPCESEDTKYAGMVASPVELLNLDVTPRHVTTTVGNGIIDGINPKQAFDVRLTIDGDENKRQFKAGEPMRFVVHVDQPAHVSLFMVSLDKPDVATLIFPNLKEKVKLVKADQQLITPASGIVVQPPTGKVLIKVIATEVPLVLASIDAQVPVADMIRFGVKNLQAEDNDGFEVIKDLNKILAEDKWGTAEMIIEIAPQNPN